MVDASSAAAASTSAAMDANEEISRLVLPQLDRHLAVPLVRFLEDNDVYPRHDLLHARLELLSGTNMVHELQNVRIELDGQSKQAEIVKETESKLEQLFKRNDELRGRADKVIEIISDPNVAAALGQDKERNLTTLREKYSLDVKQIDALYEYGQYAYSLGDYAAASDYLNSFRILSIDPVLTQSAYWGKLVSNILEQPSEGEEKDWEGCIAELKVLRDDIEAQKHSRAPAVQLQQRVAWLHWSLFVYYRLPDKSRGMRALVDAWTEASLEPGAGDKRRAHYLDAIQSAAPWLLRYLVTATVIAHQGPIKITTSYTQNNSAVQSRRAMLAPKLFQVLRVVEQEKYQYADAITEFFRLLVGAVDFEGATACLKKANEDVLRKDYFTHIYKAEFVDRARHFMSEVYCRIHHRIDIADLSSRLGLSADEGERWIVELVRDARLDAKIDLQKNIVTMNKSAPSIHQTISDRSKMLLERAQYILPAPAQGQNVAGSGGFQDEQSGERKQRQGDRPGGQRRDQHNASAGIGSGQTPKPVEIRAQ